MEAARLLEHELPDVLVGFEARPGQVAMATAVERALTRDTSLFVEAGTGTGKTLAYLIPAALSGRKVVISTATKTLEEQIVSHDVPIVSRLLAKVGLRTEFALMKGLSNYLCKRRYEELRQGAAHEVNGRDLSVLERWAARTRIGDLSELPGLPTDAQVVRLSRSSTETRIGAECRYYNECFVTGMRRRAEEVNVVIVNHHLFFADLALRTGRAEGFASAIPAYDAVIFDEAHQLEDVASDFFGTRVSSAQIEGLVHDCERSLLTLSDETRARAKVLQGALDAALLASQMFFRVLSSKARPSAEQRFILERDDLGKDIYDPYLKLDAHLDIVEAAARDLAKYAELSLVERRAADIRKSLDHLVGDGQIPGVMWLDVRERVTSLVLHANDVGKLLSDRLFARTPCVVATSATLSTSRGGQEQSFRFIKSRLGAPAETEELVVPSPFDYASRAGLYVPRDLPEPSHPTFEKLSVERMVELLSVTQGGAFVLCTSIKAMRAFGSALRKHGSWTVLVQGEGPKETVLEQFRADGNAVLCATMTFWEGVDVPGHALRLVILDKLPFAVPTDPVTIARVKQIEAEGGNAFIEYHVPTAAITLKQGFGRLIRTTLDYGIVALLDHRVLTKPYGRSLLRGLPPAKRLSSVEEVRAFWAPFMVRQIAP